MKANLIPRLFSPFFVKDEAHEAATISSGVLYPTNSGWFMVVISSLSSFICEANTNLPSQRSFIS